jgi:rSAM/selenodomain-associated transferase 1
MAKVPVAGRTKTRLAREVGTATALRFARHTANAVIMRLAADPRWRVILAITPDGSLGSRAFPAGLPRCGQGHGDLGQRMQRLLDGFPPGPVIVVGTDIPSLTPRAVAKAFRCLGHCDAVLGPASDGGFWLAGSARRRRSPPMFHHVRWSSPHTLADVLAGLHDRRVGFTDTLRDVDSAADLARIRFGRRVIGPRPDLDISGQAEAPRPPAVRQRQGGRTGILKQQE